MDERVWLHSPRTGGYFHCPVDAVDDHLGMGWQKADEPPAEPNPVTAEHLAWREQQNQTEAFIPKTDKPSKPAARRGAENGEMSNG